MAGKQGLTDEGQRIVADVAQRHGVSAETVTALLMALAARGGNQAQFSIHELGGMGQWSQGGMIMVGDMFNQGLKARVDALCVELAGLLRGSAVFVAAPLTSQSQSQSSGSGGVSLFVPGASPFASRWPAELGAPSSAGSQNDLHYAVFPATRRLAIERGGQVTVYDIGDNVISGFSQQQSGDQTLTFTSQHGTVRVADLAVVLAGNAAAAAKAAAQQPPAGAASAAEAVQAMPPTPAQTAAAAPAQTAAVAPAQTAAVAPAASDDDIFAKIERLAELRRKDVITAQEFETKKTELLARI